MNSFDIAILIAGFSMFAIPIVLVLTIIMATRKKISWKTAAYYTIWTMSLFLVFWGLCKYVRPYFEDPVNLYTMIALFAVLLIAPSVYIGYRKDQNMIKHMEADTVKWEQKVVKTRIVDSSHIATSRPSTGSAVGRAIVGGTVFGGLGAFIGALTAKEKVTEKHSTTFLVTLDDGSTYYKTVDNNSRWYHVYMTKLEVD